MTVAVLIGNSDDRLTQQEWSRFFAQVDMMIRQVAPQCYFIGAPATTAPWQNACWVFALHPEQGVRLQEQLTSIRREFRQDSYAWLEGETKML